MHKRFSARPANASTIQRSAIVLSATKNYTLIVLTVGGGFPASLSLAAIVGLPWAIAIWLIASLKGCANCSERTTYSRHGKLLWRQNRRGDQVSAREMLV